MALMHRPASEPKRIGEELIGKYYPDILDSGCRVEFIFRSECGKKGGHPVLGTLSKISGRQAFLSQLGTPSEGYVEPKYLAYYLVEIAEPEWKDLSPSQRVALVDHELAHCLLEHDDDEGWTLKTTGHDLEEFSSIVERHGLWHPGLEWFARRTAKQWTLFESAEA